MLPVIIAALVVGVMLTVLLASQTDDAEIEPARDATLETRLERDYGDRWRSLGITDWDYDPEVATIFYLPVGEWEKIDDARGEAILKELWRDTKEVVEADNGHSDQVFIMIHDAKRRMQAAYNDESGVVSYK